MTTHFHRRFSASLLAALLLPATGLHAQLGPDPQPGKPAQQDPDKAEPALPTTPAELIKFLAQHGVHVDLEAKQVRVDSKVGNPTDPIEYLLIAPRGKGHESIFVADVKPSLLNTGLLLLGLEPGTNARVEEKDPLPTLEEVQAGAEWLTVFPPEGQRVYLTADWEFDGQKHKDVPIEELLRDTTTGEAVIDNHWIFLGGNHAPLLRGEDPVFVGDYQGNIVSSCYMHPPNHLVTMVHERARDEQNWWVTSIVPDPGTPVRITFHLDMPASVKARIARVAAEKAEREEAAREEAGKDKAPEKEGVKEKDKAPSKETPAEDAGRDACREGDAAGARQPR